MSSYLSKDFTATPTNAKKFTFSCWFKTSEIGKNQPILSNNNTGGNQFSIDCRSDKKIGVIGYISSAVTSNHETSRLLLDSTSWYHLVVAGDSTLSTSTDRLKIYINGERLTSFSSATAITQNNDYEMNKEMSGTSLGWHVGANSSASNYFRGNIAHIHNVDGLAYAPTVFGETDSTTGGWKAILSPSVTYGNNGWFLKMENASALGTDSSGNGTTFSVNGDLKQSPDTPSNNFCTLDNNQAYDKSHVRYAGTAYLGTTGNAQGVNSTQMVKNGKWYFEVKNETDRTSSNGATIGIVKNGTYASSFFRNSGSAAIVGNSSSSNGCEGISYQLMNSTPNILDAGGGGTVNYGTQASANDIIMCAVDLSAATSKIWFGKNGTWFNAPGTSNAGVPNTGANAGLSFAKGDDFWGINITGVVNAADNANKHMFCNFGNGYFGATAVSSGNADDNSVGIFEYDVPAGFYAICTKNIKSYG